MSRGDRAPREASYTNDQLLYAVGTLYYLEERTQAEIADRLGTSRATVSRLLAEARRRGVVRIEVIAPDSTDDEELAERLAEALDLQAVHIAPFVPQAMIGASLAPALSEALRKVGLAPNDVLLVSSGRTVYEAAQAELPPLPGVVITTTVGGQDDPEAWYQTNEIIRQVAAKVGGKPQFLFAPALPGPQLYAQLLEDPTFTRVQELWRRASCAVVGVGAPPSARRSLPSFVPVGASWLADAAGDVCTRFFGPDGRPIDFEGSDRMIATDLEILQAIPTVIAVAAGQEKAAGIAAAARTGWFDQLVTDAPTAAAVLAEAAG